MPQVRGEGGVVKVFIISVPFEGKREYETFNDFSRNLLGLMTDGRAVLTYMEDRL